MLRGGTIEWEGAAVGTAVPGVGKSHLASGLDLAIVGGAGRYAGARGVLRGVSVAHNRERDTLTFTH